MIRRELLKQNKSLDFDIQDVKFKADPHKGDKSVHGCIGL